MSRPLRVEFEGAVYHVMARGNERREIFRDDFDRKTFLLGLAEMVERFGVLLHVYCLMPNHYHLVVETPRGNLSQAFGWLQTTYTVRFNRRWRRSGHLFHGRYKAQLVDAEGYGRGLVRYVHLNPVRPRDKRSVVAAERAKELDMYPWSSHRDYAGLRRAPSWLRLDWLGYWGKGARGRREYRAFMRSAFGKAVENPWEDLRGGLVLGADDLWRKVQSLVGKKSGAQGQRWVAGGTADEISQRLRRALKEETDEHVKIWARVRLGGERMVDLAKELGYADGTAVTQIVKRLKAAAAKNKPLQGKLKHLKATLSFVRGVLPKSL
jgi:REP element-mobilizing transposase RayT